MVLYCALILDWLWWVTDWRLILLFCLHVTELIKLLPLNLSIRMYDTLYLVLWLNSINVFLRKLIWFRVRFDIQFTKLILNLIILNWWIVRMLFLLMFNDVKVGRNFILCIKFMISFCWLWLIAYFGVI